MRRLTIRVLRTPGGRISAVRLILEKRK